MSTARSRLELEAELMMLMEESLRVARTNKLRLYYPDTDRFLPDGETVSYHARDKYPKHLEFFKVGAKFQERCAMAANRVGKALRHGTKVATPSGWRAIEDLKVGDVVIAGDGSLTRVLGVYPQGEVGLYSLNFDGHTDIDACGEHQWLYQHPQDRYSYRQSHGKKVANAGHGRWRVGKTLDLIRFGSGPRMRAVVPGSKAWDFPHDASLPMDPYLLGVLLGDGSLSRDSVKLSTTDEEILQAFAGHFDISFYSRCDYGVLGAMPVIRGLGLQGRRSGDKFIPERYLRSSPAQRLAVLQGLMDTDGSIHGEGGNMEYSTCSDALADGVEWLCVSLGMKTRRVRRHTKAQNGNGKPSWRISIRSGGTCPFRLARKVQRWKPLKETSNWILHKVTPAGRGLATCIEVAHSSHTYVIEHGIVTHNTEGMGGYETALHLTGQYPAWWNGRRFKDAPKGWAAGKTNETTRDIVQAKLFGKVVRGQRKGLDGTGLIPLDCIGEISWKQGVSDLVDTVMVKHVSGVWAEVSLKSYQQGRDAFEGTERHFVWLDEEPPMDVYGECLMRTATVDGIIYITFTPLEGVSEVVRQFLPGGGDTSKKSRGGAVSLSKYLITCGWNDVPHLDSRMKANLLEATPIYLRKARTEGIPSLGSGAIFPLTPDEEAAMICAPIPIPGHWAQLGALDFGWDHPTGAVRLAWDRDTDTIYVTANYREREKTPIMVVGALKPWGEWLPWAWPHDGLQHDKGSGVELAEQYRGHGLKMLPEMATWPDGPDHTTISRVSVEAGLSEMLERMQTGRWKVFSTCTAWIEEYRLYHRKDGKVVKDYDDVLSASRYGLMMLRYAVSSPQAQRQRRSSPPRDWRVC